MNRELLLKFKILQSSLRVKGELKERSNDSLRFVAEDLTPFYQAVKGGITLSTKTLSGPRTEHPVVCSWAFLLNIIFVVVFSS